MRMQWIPGRFSPPKRPGYEANEWLENLVGNDAHLRPAAPSNWSEAQWKRRNHKINQDMNDTE